MESQNAVVLGIGILAAGLVVAAGSMGAAGTRVEQAPVEQSVAEPEPEGGTIGPDVIVGVLNGTSHYGTIGDITAYSVGTTSCNVGDEDLEWTANTNRHPVIGQNMYRLKDNRLMQIGQSWLKHGFLALAQNACDLGCQNPNNGALLGVGCSDPYGSGLNGSQGGLGPRFEVNAATGEFLYPFSFDNQTGNTIYKRLQVLTDDVEPAQNDGALYFVEGHYVTPDDAESGNQNNNASYRQVTVQNDLDLSFAGETVRESPAIQAWQDFDPTVDIRMADVSGDGRLIVATRTSDNFDGTWRYEYAIHNLNSHRSASSFSVPMAPGTEITNLGFHDVPYHSGEPYNNEAWAMEVGDDNVTWRLADVFHDGFESGDMSAWGAAPDLENTANALRWGTMYNFWFDADRSPVSVTGSIGLFRPGVTQSTNVVTEGPE